MRDWFMKYCLFACKENVLWVSVTVTAPCVLVSSAAIALPDSVYLHYGFYLSGTRTGTELAVTPPADLGDVAPYHS